MLELTEDGRRIVDELSARHQLSTDAVVTLLRALAAGNGMQAQFNHYELGGMGQWSQGGMIMIGDMFNNALKYRVDSLANELSGLLRAQTLLKPVSTPQYGSLSGREGVSLFVPGGGFSAGNWPAELGQPGSAGSQNDLHYAYFPDSRRLAIRKGGHITLYDTGEHAIGGFSQAQSGDQSLTFSSQYGVVRVADLPVVPSEAQTLEPSAAVAAEAVPAGNADAAPSMTWQPAVEETLQPSPAPGSDDIFAKIERLAELRQKGILSETEFSQKKAELLARL
ncbi:hypothetical protein C3941_12225 [Kaistia algarum]|uniref:SHOCT domain-containing protein n=1 Tax=Kaistia algarum TaxID=2083279 RepID=UPI000CE72E14|nr:SHOCT domain-containing protein [Kaistia algarum]MCX5515115.1 SHOCT domain-containing protein [Kaistia algarum]PPE79841.1 hypothetical protein C3941_12225 [Kaistia algarum]